MQLHVSILKLNGQWRRPESASCKIYNDAERVMKMFKGRNILWETVT